MPPTEHHAAEQLAPHTAPPTNYEHIVRVRYVECDPMGVAHHSSYVAWLEEARTEMLRASGVSYADMEAAGAFLVITSLALKYRRPIRYDDRIEIEVAAEAKGRTRLRHLYTLFRQAAEAGVARERVATAETELACVGPDGRPTLMPMWLVPNEVDG